ncbi:hypothetical protein KNP414_01986 [Paenibacillus mucilaginosus KNP414]|uniref:Uncharacterized protein n=1 Tax=Paenibacillus mucilaginosus (strain KNP414) TaxID=1036673 RepID=F8FRJ0_PAEMK|nr:hypothetical protein KNP414_01986 [Paenibacillus mucilaginosus KNP414]
MTSSSNRYIDHAKRAYHHNTTSAVMVNASGQKDIKGVTQLDYFEKVGLLMCFGKQ